VLHCISTSTCEEFISPAWYLSGNQQCFRVASLRHPCSLHADVAKRPKCMPLPKVHPKIIWCCTLLQCMSNAGHDWFYACAECIVGTGPGAVEEPSPTSKTTSVFLSYKLGMSHQNKEFVHDSNHNFSFSTGSCPILVADHAGYRRESPSDTVASFFSEQLKQQQRQSPPHLFLHSVSTLSIVSDKCCKPMPSLSGNLSP